MTRYWVPNRYLLVVEKFDNLDDLSIQSHLRKRIGENKVRTSLDDIFSIFCAVDNSGLRDNKSILSTVYTKQCNFGNNSVDISNTWKQKKERLLVGDNVQVLATVEFAC